MFSNLSVGDTLLVTVTGMLIVFFVLLILIAIISMFGKVASGKGGGAPSEKKQPDNTVQKAAVKADKKPSGTALDVTTDRATGIAETTASDDEIIAVIAAAVAVYTEKTGGAAPVIRSIRDEKGRPIWATAGLIRNTRAF